MIWLLFSGFFCWLALREVYRRWIVHDGYDAPDTSPISKTYFAIMATFAILFAYKPLHTWHFERFLSQQARTLSESKHAKVHCNTVFDTFFDSNSLAAGHASPATGKIVFQYPWCKRLMRHLSQPSRASDHGIFSVQMFVHEAMHIRGEMNDAQTECQAIQRHYRGARMLGIPDPLARESARAYYHGNYKQRAGFDGLGGQYYSEHCAPGRALDERLADSVWN